MLFWSQNTSLVKDCLRANTVHKFWDRYQALRQREQVEQGVAHGGQFRGTQPEWRLRITLINNACHGTLGTRRRNEAQDGAGRGGFAPSWTCPSSSIQSCHWELATIFRRAKLHPDAARQHRGAPTALRVPLGLHFALDNRQWRVSFNARQYHPLRAWHPLVRSGIPVPPRVELHYAC